MLESKYNVLELNKLQQQLNKSKLLLKIMESNNDKLQTQSKKPKNTKSCSFWCCAPAKPRQLYTLFNNFISRPPKRNPFPRETPRTPQTEDRFPSGKIEPEKIGCKESAKPLDEFPAPAAENEKLHYQEEEKKEKPGLVQESAQEQKLQAVTNNIPVNLEEEKLEKKGESAKSEKAVMAAPEAAQPVDAVAVVTEPQGNIVTEIERFSPKGRPADETVHVDEVFPVIEEKIDEKAIKPSAEEIDLNDDIEGEDKEEVINVSKVHSIDINLKRGLRNNTSTVHNYTQIAGKLESFHMNNDERLYTDPVDDGSPINGMFLKRGKELEKLKETMKELEFDYSSNKIKSQRNTEPVRIEEKKEAVIGYLPESNNNEKTANNLAGEHEIKKEVEEKKVEPRQSLPQKDVVPAVEPVKVQEQPLPSPQKPQGEKMESTKFTLPVETLDKSTVLDNNPNMSHYKFSSETPSVEPRPTSSKEGDKGQISQIPENLSDFIHFESNEEVDMSRSVRDSYALPTPTYSSSGGRHTELFSEFAGNRGLSRAPSEVLFSVADDKSTGHIENNLQVISSFISKFIASSARERHALGHNRESGQKTQGQQQDNSDLSKPDRVAEKIHLPSGWTDSTFQEGEPKLAACIQQFAVSEATTIPHIM
eukprot:TRINITY_DN1884_c0_g1_i1.p6 TRINITY_DN1884_c0_g1~~TRINITY_DN1884_c0_g1_i1.p6  ORF type:complete len:648 (-),score=87.68 TRINITY_DN1884_c0_g1_i1:19913-21856(-)